MTLIIGKNIQADQIRLITENGAEVIKKVDAIKMAEQQGLTLIQIASGGDMPVCKIKNLQKHMYEQTIKEKQQSKKQPGLKKLPLSVNIADRDLMRFINQGADFIKLGHKVQFSIRLRYKESTNEKTINNAKNLLEETVLQLLNTKVKSKMEGAVNVSPNNRNIIALYSHQK